MAPGVRCRTGLTLFMEAALGFPPLALAKPEPLLGFIESAGLTAKVAESNVEDFMFANTPWEFLLKPRSDSASPRKKMHFAGRPTPPG
jgi:hypothetical protein